MRFLFILFFLFQYSFLSKIFCQISVKNRHAQVQFYFRRVQSFCSVNVRLTRSRKPRYANILGQRSDRSPQKLR